MTSSNQLVWDRKYTLTEADFHEKGLPDDIGVKWKDLARALGFNQAFIDITEKEKNKCARECCIEVLVHWHRREGKDATAEKLVKALVKIGLRNVADRFPPKQCDPSQNSEAETCDLKEKADKLRARNKKLEDEADKMSARNKKLEDEADKMRARNKKLEDEADKMRVRNKKLEDEVSTLRSRNKKLENGKQQKGECELTDGSKEAEQEARESRVSETLEKCEEELETYVTKPLVVPEVRYDRLQTTAVTVDLLKVLSEHLEEQYTTTLGIAPEACQCSEDLRERFYYFAYHALQAEHDQMNHKINNSRKTLEKGPKDAKKELKNLMRLQKRRKDLVVKLEKWRRRFSPPKRSSNGRCSSYATRKKAEHSHNKETIAKLSTGMKEFEDEVSTHGARNKELDNGKQQKGEENDKSKETDQEARESRVSEILGKCKEELESYVTSPLEVREVRQNVLKLSVKVGFLKVLSEHLEEQYNTTLDIAPEACRCSEDLRDRFYYFAYHALQAEHDQMNHKINNLKKTLKGATKDDKEEFENLMCLQNRRKDLVAEMEKWRRLLSPPMRSSKIRRRSDTTTGKKLKQQNDETTKAARPCRRWSTYPMVKKEPLLRNNDEEESRKGQLKANPEP